MFVLLIQCSLQFVLLWLTIKYSIIGTNILTPLLLEYSIIFISRWFRKIQDNVQEISTESLTVHPYQSLLHIIRVPMSESAITYECIVSNKLGQDKHQISLLATLPFSVNAYPSKQVSFNQIKLETLNV